jgi:hypothetical protein
MYAAVVCMLLQQLFGVCCNTMCYGVSHTSTYCYSSISCVVALSCSLCCSVKRIGIGCEDELAAGGSARGWQDKGRGRSHAREGWGWAPCGGSGRRMVLRACGVSEAGASWLVGIRRRVVHRVGRVG